MQVVNRTERFDVVIDDDGNSFTLAIVDRHSGAFRLPPVNLPGEIKDALVEALQSGKTPVIKKTDPPPARKSSTKKTKN